MSKNSIRICILPKEGIGNPYQKLMMDGLRESGFDAIYGVKKRFFSIILTWVLKRPDWIHFDWPYSFYSINLPRPFKWIIFYWFYFQVFFIKRFTKCKLAYTLHNLDRHEVYNHKIDHKAQGIFFKYCDFVRVFNKKTIESVSEKWKGIDLNKFHVQPEGSYVSFYKNEINIEIARKYWGYAPDDFIILCLGTIRPYKGILELIDGYVASREKNWKLMIAGYPADQKYVNQIAKKCENNQDIKLFLGLQPAEKLQFFFNACNVVACPFKQIENSGSVILAMGFKKPVIAPNKGVVKHRLQGQTQLLFDDSVTEVFNLIKKMTSFELEEIGQRNYDAVEMHHWKDFSKLFGLK